MAKIENSFDLVKKSSENQVEKINQVVYKAIASSKDTPLKLGELSIDCYVLDDKDGTALLSMSGTTKILGLSNSGGNRLERFINKSEKIANYPAAVIEAVTNPIKFTIPSTSDFFSVSYGIKTETLIDICIAIKNVKYGIAKYIDDIRPIAECIINAAAKTGLKALVYENTGYEKIKKSDVYMRFFNSILSEEAKKWEKFFEDDGFLKDLAIMKHVSWARPGCYPLYFGKLLNDLVYSRIAPNLTLELTARNPKINKHRKYCHHQFFKNNGEELARKHIDKLRLLAKASGYNWELFMAMVNNAMPVQPQTDIEDLLIEEKNENED